MTKKRHTPKAGSVALSGAKSCQKSDFYWLQTKPGASRRLFVVKKGFTLVELIVSMSIAAIMMVGISAFFSSSFRNILVAQNQSAALERQSVVNEIIKDKFATLDYLVEDTSDYILSFNKNTKDQLPFSYIGIDSNDHLVFKDLLVFNKMIVDTQTSPDNHLYADSGNGNIKSASGSTPSINLRPPDNFKNFGGFEKLSNIYYVALTSENKVQECNCNSSTCTCSDLNTSQLKSPTDIAIDANGNYLFISDSGNGRVIKYEIGVGEDPQPLATGLKYPTGLAYYNDGAKEYLFIADTLDHKIRKVDANNPLKLPVVVGDGDDTTCSNTAKFCKLNLPTGLYADSTNHALYIADSGNNRILKMSDPGTPDELTFEFSPGGNYALDRITLENNNWTGGTYVPQATNRLIGDVGDYNSSSKTFSNSDRLTVFTNTACPSSGTNIYTNEEMLDVNFNLSQGDKIIINKTVYEVYSLADTDCKDDPTAASLPKGKITLKPSASPPSVSLGDPIYFANPDTVTVQIDGVTLDATGAFEKFIIKTYDIFDGLVSTDYYVERVGDGKLGTEEDTIEVVASGSDVKFPTGVTDLYFANSGEGKIRKISESPNFNFEKSLNTISTSDFNNFDYVSEFKLADKDPDGQPLTPMSFKTYNSDSILELIINAIVDEDTIQKYTLNAAIPNP